MLALGGGRSRGGTGKGRRLFSIAEGQAFLDWERSDLTVCRRPYTHSNRSERQHHLVQRRWRFLQCRRVFRSYRPHVGILLDVLPPIVHIRKPSDKAALHWCIEQMRQELREPQPGGFLVAQQLATMMLLQALRLHLAKGLKSGVGWLFALADPQMCAAISAMHADPARRWTVQAMAEHAGMSRTIFTLKFKKTVGVSPMEYLTRWRMLRASDRLVSSSDPISVIALSLGYESESAFSTAFKRVMGCSPRQYSRNPACLSHSEGDAARPNQLELIAG